jgi:protease I
VVVDGDLVTGRSAAHCHLFARTIIDLLAARADLHAAGGAPNGPARLLRSTL